MTNKNKIRQRVENLLSTSELSDKDKQIVLTSLKAILQRYKKELGLIQKQLDIVKERNRDVLEVCEKAIEEL